MGNFMSTTKPCDAQGSPSSSLSLTGSDGSNMPSLRSAVSRVDSKNPHKLSNKRRIVDSHGHKLLEVHKCLPARPTPNVKGCSSCMTRSTFTNHQPQTRVCARPDDAIPKSSDSRMKHVLIQDNANHEEEERGLYRQGTPHPTRKRMSMNCNVLIVDDDTYERKEEVEAANIRFNVAHPDENESEFVCESTSINNLTLDVTQHGKQLRNESLLSDSEENCVAPMSVDTISDENMINETSMDIKERQGEDIKIPQKKTNRVPQLRRRIAHSEYHSTNDVEILDDCNVASSHYLTSDSLPQMVRKIEKMSAGGECTPRAVLRKRKAPPEAASPRCTPKRQCRLPPLRKDTATPRGSHGRRGEQKRPGP